MASPAQIADYRASHSVAATAAHFGVSEGYVYKAVRLAKSSRSASIPASNTGVSTSPAPAPAPAVVPSVRFSPAADDVAGVSTMWRCPSTGELTRVPAGVRRRAWEDERRALHSRQAALAPPVAAAPEPVPAPEPIPAPVENGSVGGSVPIPAPMARLAAPAVALHNKHARRVAPVKPSPASVVVGWLHLYWHVWLPILAAWLLIAVASSGLQ